MPEKRKERPGSREDLEKVIYGVEGLEPYRDFLKARWLETVIRWDNRSSASRRKYFLLRASIIIGGVFIPVLSAVNLNQAFTPYLPVAIAIVSAVIAGCTAWEGVANYGEIWREKRRATELLKTEGWQFFQLSGKYADPSSISDAQRYKQMFPRFAAEVENKIAKEIGEYIDAFESLPKQLADKTYEEVNSREEVLK